MRKKRIQAESFVIHEWFVTAFQDTLDTLVRTVRVFSSDIGMEFGMKNVEFLPWEKGKQLDVKE